MGSPGRFSKETVSRSKVLVIAVLAKGHPRYTSTVDTNNYLNTVRYADQQLERLYDGLKDRGLLDSSLFIVQGDHGARIGLQGYQVQEHHGRNLRAPWVVRPPGGSRIALDMKPYALWNSLDVVPTILDALGFQESVISSYPGSSLLRPLHAAESTGYRHQTYHVHNPGGRWPTVQQGPYKLYAICHYISSFAH